MRRMPPSLRARSLMPSSPSERTLSRRRGIPTPLSLTYRISRPRRVVPTVVEMQLALRMTDRVGQRLLEHAERRGRDLGIDDLR